MNNKSKHTPGPWIAEARQHGLAIWADYENAPGEYIAIINGYEGSKEDRERNRANANLIAAAPELLEALEIFVSSITPWAGTKSIPIEDIDKADRLARAAIAKAKGE